METILIKNCQDCPFCNWDWGDASGPNKCNLIEKATSLAHSKMMPKDGIIEDCPLREESHNIMIMPGARILKEAK